MDDRQKHFNAMNIAVKLLCSLSFLLLLSFAGGSCSARPANGAFHPFGPGEKFTFDLYWEFIPAGTAVLEVLPMEEVDGEQCYHFTAEIRSSSVLDKIHKVRDRIDAYADAQMTRSMLFRKKTAEGRDKQDIQVRFDWANSRVISTDSVRGRSILGVPRFTFDPLSIFYAFRIRSLAVHTALEMPVTDGRRWALGNARILKSERIDVPAGEFDTFLVEPDMKDVEGIFKKSKGAALDVWISADGRHIPVKIRSRIKLGRIFAKLASIEGP
jgi:hypothetical protein